MVSTDGSDKWKDKFPGRIHDIPEFFSLLTPPANNVYKDIHWINFDENPLSKMI
jgi:hypothetical protein